MFQLLIHLHIFLHCTRHHCNLQHQGCCYTASVYSCLKTPDKILKWYDINEIIQKTWYYKIIWKDMISKDNLERHNIYIIKTIWNNMIWKNMLKRHDIKRKVEKNWYILKDNLKRLDIERITRNDIKLKDNLNRDVIKRWFVKTWYWTITWK